MTADSDSTRTKTCTKCGQVKTVEAFHARSCSSDGKASACKACIEAHKKAKRLVDKADWYKKIADAGKLQECGVRKCSCCKEIFVLSSDFFNARKDKSPAFSARCRTCEAKKSKENRLARNPEKKAAFEKLEKLKSDGLRECSACKNTYPATAEFFYIDRGSFRGACKTCEKSREAESRINCKEQKAAYNKMYVLKNRAALIAKNKEYRLKNRDSLNAASKANYRKNPKKYIAHSLIRAGVSFAASWNTKWLGLAGCLLQCLRTTPARLARVAATLPKRID